MPASRIHLVRHGEVHNPDGILYGRKPHFSLSETGHKMAELAAQDLKSQGRQISRIAVSPLLRTRESAEPIAKLFKLEINVDERLIEPTNIFEGDKVSFGALLRKPSRLLKIWNPRKPSWGEPYVSIEGRMLAAIEEQAKLTPSGDLIVVSHQLPIFITRRSVEGLPFAHNPRERECALSSITSIERVGSAWKLIEYREPARAVHASDGGAV
jgi:broad specificity phosphatase PhoE